MPKKLLNIRCIQNNAHHILTVWYGCMVWSLLKKDEMKSKYIQKSFCLKIVILIFVITNSKKTISY